MIAVEVVVAVVTAVIDPSRGSTEPVDKVVRE
jgi:hypothetical protein